MPPPASGDCAPPNTWPQGHLGQCGSKAQTVGSTAQTPPVPPTPGARKHHTEVSQSPLVWLSYACALSEPANPERQFSSLCTQMVATLTCGDQPLPGTPTTESWRQGLSRLSTALQPSLSFLFSARSTDACPTHRACSVPMRTLSREVLLRALHPPAQ